MAEQLTLGGEALQDAHLQVAGMAIAAAMQAPEAPAYWSNEDGGGPVVLEATVQGNSQTFGGAVSAASAGGRPTGGQRPR
jgi:hypothetical protein